VSLKVNLKVCLKVYFFIKMTKNGIMATKKEVLEFLRKNPKALEGDGLKVVSNAPTVRKTFEVEPELVDEFMKEARNRNLKIKEAIDQALRDWVKAR
jgi:glutamine synthetase adenylyltransferase